MPTTTAAHEARLNELESRIAFQDDTIAKLNDVVVAQQESIDRLAALCEGLRARIFQLNGTVEDEGGVDDVFERERPPHY